jgi:hypothetical protein
VACSRLTAIAWPQDGPSSSPWRRAKARQAQRQHVAVAVAAQVGRDALGRQQQLRGGVAQGADQAGREAGPGQAGQRGVKVGAAGDLGVQAGAARPPQQVGVGQVFFEVAVQRREGVGQRLVGGEAVQHRLPQLRQTAEQDALPGRHAGHDRGTARPVRRQQVLDQIVPAPRRQPVLNHLQGARVGRDGDQVGQDVLGVRGRFGRARRGVEDEAARVRRPARVVGPVEERDGRVRRQDGGEVLQRRGLARPGGAEQGDDAAPAGVQQAAGLVFQQERFPAGGGVDARSDGGKVRRDHGRWFPHGPEEMRLSVLQL